MGPGWLTIQHGGYKWNRHQGSARLWHVETRIIAFLDTKVMDPTKSGSGPYRWLVIVLWMLTHATGWVVVLGIGILLPSIATEFRLSYSMQGLLASGPLWANTVLYIPLSIWLARYPPKLLTTITLVLGMVFLFFQASSSLFAVLLVSRFAFGITIPAREPARMLLMQQWFPSREFFLVNAVTARVIGGGSLV